MYKKKLEKQEFSSLTPALTPLIKEEELH